MLTLNEVVVSVDTEIKSEALDECGYFRLLHRSGYFIHI